MYFHYEQPLCRYLGMCLYIALLLFNVLYYYAQMLKNSFMVDRIAGSLYIIKMMLSLFWPSLTARPFPIPSTPPPPPSRPPPAPAPPPPHPHTSNSDDDYNDTDRKRKKRVDERPKLGRESHDKTMVITPSEHLKPCHLPHPFFCALHNNEQ